MGTSNTINLIRSKPIESPQHEAVAASLRRSGYIALMLVLFVGLIVGILYALFSAQKSNLLSEKEGYVKRVESDRQIEGFFRSIKDRIHIVELTISSKKPWAKMLDEVRSIVTPPLLSSITVNDQNSIMITVNAGSVDLVLPIVNSLIAQAQANRLSHPQLVSFQLTETGTVKASFTFSAVF